MTDDVTVLAGEPVGAEVSFHGIRSSQAGELTLLQTDQRRLVDTTALRREAEALHEEADRLEDPDRAPKTVGAAVERARRLRERLESVRERVERAELLDAISS